MAGYLALRFEAGKLNYNEIMSKKTFKPFKEEVDEILALDGYEVNEDGWAVKAESNTK